MGQIFSAAAVCFPHNSLSSVLDQQEMATEKRYLDWTCTKSKNDKKIIDIANRQAEWMFNTVFACCDTTDYFNTSAVDL